MRPKIKVQCDHCKKKTTKFKHHIEYNIKKGYKTFCSKKCSNLAKKTGKHVECANCNKKIWRQASSLNKSKSSKYFCSKHCATVVNNTIYKTGENHPNYTGGSASYRDRALKLLPNICAKCTYNNIPVLEVHHIDGNRDNNILSNLMILCPTHHKEITINSITV